MGSVIKDLSLLSNALCSSFSSFLIHDYSQARLTGPFSICIYEFFELKKIFFFFFFFFFWGGGGGGGKTGTGKTYKNRVGN